MERPHPRVRLGDRMELQVHCMVLEGARGRCFTMGQAPPALPIHGLNSLCNFRCRTLDSLAGFDHTGIALDLPGRRYWYELRLQACTPAAGAKLHSGFKQGLDRPIAQGASEGRRAE